MDTPLLVCIRKPGRNRGWPRLHFYSARMLVQEYRQMTAEFGNMHAPKCDAMIHRTGLLCAAIGDVKPCLFSIRTARVEIRSTRESCLHVFIIVAGCGGAGSFGRRAGCLGKLLKSVINQNKLRPGGGMRVMGMQE